MSWWEYVQRVAVTSNQSEIARRIGIAQSAVNRWKTSTPQPESVVAFAEAYSRAPLEAFVAAGFLSEEDIKAKSIQVKEVIREVPVADLSNAELDDLLAEIRRRAAK